MFDKFKARIEKLEETNETFRKTKAHVVKYQVVYAMVGTAIVTTVVIRSTMRPQVTHIVNEFKPVNHNIGNVVNNTVNNVGHCCKIVLGLDDNDKLWPKVAVLADELAEEHNVSANAVRVMLSRHFRGELENVFGKHYRPYGVTTTG